MLQLTSEEELQRQVRVIEHAAERVTGVHPFVVREAKTTAIKEVVLDFLRREAERV